MEKQTTDTTLNRILQNKWILPIGIILSIFIIAVSVKELTNGYSFNIEGMRVEVGGRTGIHFMMLPGIMGMIIGLSAWTGLYVYEKRNAKSDQRSTKRALMRDRKVYNIVIIILVSIGFALFVFSFNQDYGVRIYNGTATVGDNVSYVKTTLNALYSEDELSSYLRGWSFKIDSPSDIRRIIDGSRFGS